MANPFTDLEPHSTDAARVSLGRKSWARAWWRRGPRSRTSAGSRSCRIRRARASASSRRPPPPSA